MILAVPVFSQKVEDGWKGLLPFKSTKEDVEKVLGKGKQKPDAWQLKRYKYDTDEAVVDVEYAELSCDEKTDPYDRFDVPSDTVIRYRVQLKKMLPISELSFETIRFAHVPSHTGVDSQFYFSYMQANQNLDVGPNEFRTGSGIEISGKIVGDRDYARGFMYGPPWGEREKRRCNK